MKSESAFVRPDGTVHLDPEPAVNVELALIVLPRDAKHDDALRLNDALDDLGLTIFGVLIEDEGQRFDYFLDGLVELGFARVLGFHVGHQSGDIVFHGIACEWAALSNGSQVFSEGRKLDAGDSVPAMVHERGEAYSGTQSEQKQNLWQARQRGLVGRAETRGLTVPRP